MAQVRGRDLIDARGFVARHYGRGAVERVAMALAPDVRLVLSGELHETGWYPLDLLVRFLATARQSLDPGSPDFYRRQGYYAAQSQKAQLLKPMTADPETTARMAPTIFQMFYDVGHLVVVGADPREASGQIHDFPATPELCQRFCGIWEGIADAAQRGLRAEETKCVSRGDACCEFRLVPDVPAGPG